MTLDMSCLATECLQYKKSAERFLGPVVLSVQTKNVILGRHFTARNRTWYIIQIH